MKKALVTAALLALVLAGCSPGSNTSSSGGEEGNGQGTVKMVLWPGPEGEAMDKVVKAYNADQGAKDKIKVKMTLLSRQDTFSKEAALMAAKSSQQDIYFTASYNVGQYANALDPLEGVDAANYFPVAVDGLKYQGKQYALPLDVSNHFLLYRKDLIDELLSNRAEAAKYRAVAKKAIGEVRDPKDPADWDWNDYIAMSAWFSKSVNPDSATKYGTILPAKNLLYNTMLWDNVLWGEGGSWTTADGKANLDTPETIKAINIYKTVYKNGYTSPDSSQAEFPETQAALKSGNAAFGVQWSAGFAELNDKSKSPEVAGKMAIAPVPGHKTHVHALAVSVNKYSKNKKAAVSFLKYLSTTGAMDAYAKAGGIPAMPKVLEDNKSINPAFGQIATSINDYGYSVPVFPNTFQAYSKLAEILSGAWIGEKSPEDAAKEADTELAKLLK